MEYGKITSEEEKTVGGSVHNEDGAQMKQTDSPSPDRRGARAIETTLKRKLIVIIVSAAGALGLLLFVLSFALRSDSMRSSGVFLAGAAVLAGLFLLASKVPSRPVFLPVTGLYVEIFFTLICAALTFFSTGAPVFFFIILAAFSLVAGLIMASVAIGSKYKEIGVAGRIIAVFSLLLPILSLFFLLPYLFMLAVIAGM